MNEQTEYIDIRRCSHRGKNYYVAIERAAYHPDRLTAWQGKRNSPHRVWQQQAIETRAEFYERVKKSL